MMFRTRVKVTDGDSFGMAPVTWHLELEARAWGVKSIIITVPEQKLELSMTEEHEDGEDTDTGKTYDLTDVIVSEPVFTGSIDTITPFELENTAKGWVLHF